VTEIAPLKQFYKAEDYHQNYFNQNAKREPVLLGRDPPQTAEAAQKGTDQGMSEDPEAAAPAESEVSSGENSRLRFPRASASVPTNRSLEN
jgi:hypothetical protein